MKPSPLRQLTLRLACLTSADRDWILSQLLPSEREQISALLTELSSLGLAEQPAVISALLEDMSADSGRLPPTLASQDLLAAADTLQRPIWVALLLQALNEPQRRELESALPGEPLAYRRWSSMWSTRSIPSAWVGALKRHAAVNRGGGHHE